MISNNRDALRIPFASLGSSSLLTEWWQFGERIKSAEGPEFGPSRRERGFEETDLLT